MLENVSEKPIKDLQKELKKFEGQNFVYYYTHLRCARRIASEGVNALRKMSSQLNKLELSPLKITGVDGSDQWWVPSIFRSSSSETVQWKELWGTFREKIQEMYPEGNGNEADAVIICTRFAERILEVWTLAPPPKKSTILLGNPGVGKSRLLELLSRSRKFARSRGTDFLEVYNCRHGRYYVDTPGIVDAKAAAEIREALNEDGEFSLAFVVEMVKRKWRDEDLAFINTVLDALVRVPKIKCGIIINKVSRKEQEAVQASLSQYASTLNTRCRAPNGSAWTEKDFFVIDEILPGAFYQSAGLSTFLASMFATCNRTNCIDSIDKQKFDTELQRQRTLGRNASFCKIAKTGGLLLALLLLSAWPVVGVEYLQQTLQSEKAKMRSNEKVIAATKEALQAKNVMLRNLTDTIYKLEHEAATIHQQESVPGNISILRERRRTFEAERKGLASQIANLTAEMYHVRTEIRVAQEHFKQIERSSNNLLPHFCLYCVAVAVILFFLARKLDESRVSAISEGLQEPLLL